jgi:hypothetical protein
MDIGTEESLISVIDAALLDVTPALTLRRSELVDALLDVRLRVREIATLEMLELPTRSEHASTAHRFRGRRKEGAPEGTAA